MIKVAKAAKTKVKGNDRFKSECFGSVFKTEIFIILYYLWGGNNVFIFSTYLKRGINILNVQLQEAGPICVCGTTEDVAKPVTIVQLKIIN